MLNSNSQSSPTRSKSPPHPGNAGLVLLVSFRRTGASATRHKMAAATAICVVPAAIFVRFGWSYLKAGWQAAYGDVAPLLNEGVAPSIFLRDTVNSAGYAYWLICGCLLVVALIRGRRDFRRLSLGLASIAIALVYLVMASLKPESATKVSLAHLAGSALGGSGGHSAGAGSACSEHQVLRSANLRP